MDCKCGCVPATTGKEEEEFASCSYLLDVDRLGRIRAFYLLWARLQVLPSTPCLGFSPVSAVSAVESIKQLTQRSEVRPSTCPLSCSRRDCLGMECDAAGRKDANAFFHRFSSSKRQGSREIAPLFRASFNTAVPHCHPLPLRCARNAARKGERGYDPALCCELQ